MHPTHPHSPVRLAAGARRLATVLAVAVIAALGALVGPAPQAQAAAFQYWGYWQLNGATWGFATKGPAQITPADGSVEGWRFAVGDESSTRMPRVTPTFAQLCGNTPADPAKKRVGLVVDFGRVVDGDGTTTPPALIATCALVPPSATGADVLAAAGAVKSDKGLICSVSGYPATGCGVPVATMSPAQAAADSPIALPTPTPSGAPTSAAAATSPASSTGGGTSLPVWLGLAVVVIALAAVAARRRRASSGG